MSFLKPREALLCPSRVRRPSGNGLRRHVSVSACFDRDDWWSLLWEAQHFFRAWSGARDLLRAVPQSCSPEVLRQIPPADLWSLQRPIALFLLSTFDVFEDQKNIRNRKRHRVLVDAFLFQWRQCRPKMMETFVLGDESLTVWRTRSEEKVAHRGQHNCFCSATHTHVCHPGLSPPPSWAFSITGWLGLCRDDGWGQRGALSGLLLRPACHRRAPRRPSIWGRRPSNPHPITWRRFRPRKKQEARKEKKQDRKSGEEMENKLFTLTANAPQRVVKRKRGASAYRRDVWAPGRGKSGRGGWANPQGRR